MSRVVVRAEKVAIQQQRDVLQRQKPDKPFQFENQSFSVTINLGVATTTGCEEMKASELIQVADAKLYQVKHDGRNRVVG